MAPAERLAIRVAFACVAAVALAGSTTSAGAKRPAVVHGSPAGTYRGVIEGFYGVPWTPLARRSMIAWMGRHHMNTFVYAPKDDPYQRAAWRTRYPARQVSHFRKDLAVGRGAGVRFTYSISPGLDMCYSAAADREALTRKLGQLRRLGVRDFMLAFDDISPGFSCDADTARYGSGGAGLGRAHAEVASAVLRWLRATNASSRLIVVPTDYSGTRSTPYLAALAGNLARAVDVAWTGPWGVSGTISSPQADAIARVLGRRPVVWDNYPVNDFDPQRLHLGPVAGRSPTLMRHVAGLLAIPMNQAEASKLPLYTLGRYFSAPRTYLPLGAWSVGVAELAGSRTAAALLERFAENSLAAATFDDPVPTWSRDSPALWKRLARAGAALRGADWMGAANALEGELRHELAAARKRWPNRLLAAELKPWLTKLRLDALAGLASAAVLRKTRPTLTAVRSTRVGGWWRVSGRARAARPAVVASALARLDRAWASASAAPQELHGGTLRFAYALAHAYGACGKGRLRVTVDGRSAPLTSAGRFALATRLRPRSVVASQPGRRTRARLGAMPAVSSPPSRSVRAALVRRLSALGRAVTRRDADALAPIYDASFRSTDGLDYSGVMGIWRPFLAASKRITSARFSLRLLDDGPLRCGGPVVTAVDWKVGGLVPQNFPHTNNGYGTIGDSAALLWRRSGSAWRIVAATPRMP